MTIGNDYVKWASTLDSAGQDSTAARDRMMNTDVISALETIIDKAINTGHKAGLLKKYIYYGDESKFTAIGRTQVWASHALDRERDYASIRQDKFLSKEIIDTARRLDDHEVCRLLHCILGLFDEAAELAEALEAYLLKGTPIDMTNIREELGDTEWYIGACGAKFLGDETLDPILDANYRKLTTRYPDAVWKQEHAIDELRDKDKEREALEGTDNKVKRIVYVMRTINGQNERVWVLFDDFGNIVWGGSSQTRAYMLHKMWKPKYGDWDTVVRYKGIARLSEAVATMASHHPNFPRKA
jgi:NTP pyrophosphatase (non-canonical NTP hydrolase)